MSEEQEQLPHGWIWTTIGEVIYPSVEQRAPDSSSPFTYVEISSVDNRAKSIVAATSLPGNKAPTRARQRLKVGDILVSMTRPNLNAVAMISPSLDGAIGSTGFDALRPVLISSEWLFYAVQTQDFITEMTCRVLGVVYPAVRPKDIRSFRLPLPPLYEQQRIIAEIEKQFSRLNAAVTLLERTRDNLHRYRTSILKAACEGRLVQTEAELARAEGRGYETAEQLLRKISLGRHSGSQSDLRSDATSQPALPEGWTWAAIKDLIITGPQNGLYIPQSLYGLGTSIIRIDDFQIASSRSSSELRRVRVDVQTLESFSIRPGDLLINRVNSPSHLGKSLVIENRHLPAVFESNMMRLSLSEEVVPGFVQIYLQSAEGRARLTSGAKWAVNQASINQGDVLGTPVPLPPVAEQMRVLAEAQRRLSIIEELKTQVEASLKRTETLRRAILECAFKGRFVLNDFSGEPASILLERIRRCRMLKDQKESRSRRDTGIKPAASVPSPEARTTLKPRRGRGNARNSASSPSGQPNKAAKPIPENHLNSRDDGRTTVDNDDQDFLALSRDEQIDLIWAALFGLGTMEKDEAIRAAALYLRDEGMIRFRRLRTGGPVYEAIASAIDRGVREGSFDRPKRGHVRALLADARDYGRDDWRHCLLESLDHEAILESEALRAAAEWARENMGLEFARLREGGVILRGLKAALRRAIRRGEVSKMRGLIVRSLQPAEERV